MSETTPLPDRHSRFWRDRARDWADVQEPIFLPFFHTVLDRAAPKPGSRHLDIGCGSGLMLRMAAECGLEVAGVEPADSLLQVARARLPMSRLQNAPPERLPFPDSSFDLVTSLNTAACATDPKAALSEIRRVATRGSTVVVAVSAAPDRSDAAAVIVALGGIGDPMRDRSGHFALAGSNRLAVAAEDAGLQVVELFEFASHWHYPDEATAIRGLDSVRETVSPATGHARTTAREVHRNTLSRFRQDDGSIRIMALHICLLART